MKIVFILIILLAQFTCNSQVNKNSEINRISDKLIILKAGNLILDSISISNFDKKNQYLKLVNGKILSIELKVPSMDNFSKSYFLFKQFIIEEKKFVLINSFIVPINNCNIRKLKFTFNKTGLCWKYKNSSSKVSKGILEYQEFSSTKVYEIPSE